MTRFTYVIYAILVHMCTIFNGDMIIRRVSMFSFGFWSQNGSRKSFDIISNYFLAHVFLCLKLHFLSMIDVVLGHIKTIFDGDRSIRRVSMSSFRIWPQNFPFLSFDIISIWFCGQKIFLPKLFCLVVYLCLIQRDSQALGPIWGPPVYPRVWYLWHSP